jgi:hypothetical protein
VLAEACETVVARTYCHHPVRLGDAPINRKPLPQSCELWVRRIDLLYFSSANFEFRHAGGVHGAGRIVDLLKWRRAGEAAQHNFACGAVTSTSNSSGHDASLDHDNNAHGNNMDNGGHDSNKPA